MEDIDAFLDSLEESTPSPATPVGGLPGQEGGAGTLDDELEALFDDFNAMVNEDKDSDEQLTTAHAEAQTPSAAAAAILNGAGSAGAGAGGDDDSEGSDDDVLNYLPGALGTLGASAGAVSVAGSAPESVAASIHNTPSPSHHKDKGKDKDAQDESAPVEPVEDAPEPAASGGCNVGKLVVGELYDPSAPKQDKGSPRPTHYTTSSSSAADAAAAAESDDFLSWLDEANSPGQQPPPPQGPEQGLPVPPAVTIPARAAAGGGSSSGSSPMASRAGALGYLQKMSTTATDHIPAQGTAIAANGSGSINTASVVNMNAFFAEVFGVGAAEEEGEGAAADAPASSAAACAPPATKALSSSSDSSSNSVSRDGDGAVSEKEKEGDREDGKDSNTRGSVALARPVGEQARADFEDSLSAALSALDGVTAASSADAHTIRELKKKLRLLLYQHGYIPRGHRLAVWAALLPACSAQAQALSAAEGDHTDPTEGPRGDTDEEFSLSHNSLERIAADAQAICDLHKTKDSNSRNQNQSSSLVATVAELLQRLCREKKREYHPLYTYLLHPLLQELQVNAPDADADTSGAMAEVDLTKARVYPLWECLITHFVPILDLPSQGPYCSQHPVASISAAVKTSCHWLRLLLFYHNPLASVHLDRTLPGWEQPLMWESSNGTGTGRTRGSSRSMILSCSDMRLRLRADGDEEGTSDLESGESGADTTSAVSTSASGTANTTTTTSGDDGNTNDIASAPPSKVATGCIPIHFLCGVFSAAVPAQHALALTDWALLVPERCAGVYLTAALLHIFSPFLLHMTGNETREWLRDVAEGQGSWFRSPLLPSRKFFPHDHESIAEHACQQGLTWSSFVAAWVHVASAMRRRTPTSFRDAVSSTDRDWAQEVARRLVCSGAREEEEAATAEAEVAANAADAAAANASVNASVNAQAGAGGALSSFRRLSMIATSTAGTVGASLTKALNDAAVAGEEKVRRLRSSSNGSSYRGGAGEGGGGSSNTSSSSGSPRGEEFGDASTFGTRLAWAHERFMPGSTTCLWSHPAEVLPCLLGSGTATASSISPTGLLSDTNRRPVLVPDLHVSMRDALAAYSTHAPSGYLPLLPPLDAATSCSSYSPDPDHASASASAGRVASKSAPKAFDRPFFFCLDCRTAAERRTTGIFPKSLLLDVHFCEDPDAIAAVMDMLEPLRGSSVHLCILGSGEGYVRYMYRHQQLLRNKRKERSFFLADSWRGVGDGSSGAKRLGINLNIGGEGTTSGRLLAMARGVSINSQGAATNTNSNSTSSTHEADPNQGVAASVAITTTTSESNGGNGGGNSSTSTTSTTSTSNSNSQIVDDYEASERTDDEPALCEILAEYRLQLNTIAMFFIKRSFPSVSIVDGGMYGALEVLTANLVQEQEQEQEQSSVAIVAAEDDDDAVRKREAEEPARTGGPTGGPSSREEPAHLQLQWPLVRLKLSSLLVDPNIPMIEHLVRRTHDLTVATEDSRSRTSSFGAGLGTSGGPTLASGSFSGAGAGGLGLESSSHSTGSGASMTSSTSSVGGGGCARDGEGVASGSARRSSLFNMARNSVSQAAAMIGTAAATTNAGTGAGSNTTLDSQSHGDPLHPSGSGAYAGVSADVDAGHSTDTSELLSSYADRAGTSLPASAPPLDTAFASASVTAGWGGMMSGMRRASSQASAGWSMLSSSASATAGTTASPTQVPTPIVPSKPKPTFVIDDDEEEDESPPTSPLSSPSPVKAVPNPRVHTEAERALALAMHRLNGLRRGDEITIAKEHLPGAVLFPANKFTTVHVEPLESVLHLPASSSSTEEEEVKQEQEEPEPAAPQVQVRLQPRFLVVSRERFLVLRVLPASSQSGTSAMSVGAKAVVTLNVHLTQLLRMAFRKRDPELVTFVFACDGTPATMDVEEDDDDSTESERVQRFRVSKKKELIEALQAKMKRFK